jgi:hypothetical protein
MGKTGIVLLACVLLSGCVASVYTKQVIVNRDGEGKVINSTEIETIQQQGATDGIQFKNLKVREDRE